MDRQEVEVRQRMELTCTNQPCGLTWNFSLPRRSGVALNRQGLPLFPDEEGFPVTMAEGIHLFPSRTQKLSPPAPMILHG